MTKRLPILPPRGTPVMWGNIPVPYTAGWTGEQPQSFEVRRIPALGNHPFLWETTDNPGVGKPMLSHLHTGRAARVLIEGICQICRRRFGKADVRWCIGDRSVVLKGYPLISGGLPMCAGCCLVALTECPNLAKRIDTDDNLRVYRADQFTVTPAVLGPIPEAEGGNPAVNELLAAWPPMTVMGMPKIAVTQGNGFMARQWIDKAQQPAVEAT